MIHDLIASVVVVLSGQIEKIVVDNLIKDTFHAHVYIEKEGEKYIFDSRPSDAIVLALRVGCSMYVEDNLFELVKANII